ncbi:phosphoethanolamine transferase [Cronobacter muytjensii]|uniref:Phosphoethanolamine transferase n=1 Tax=Cronobacter muytjensii TaxID=413501 RepID=A0A2T7AVR2_9ENTR|nr:phosphoethanolamine transferase [Cronobacter muytjensii]KAB0878735.1 phosphoethanolamine transferase [Cronobacter muytjensii]MBF4810506.1 phosphoethanolamine transferase [Cronobacter muytjensii]PUX16181.1 sulfatase [Cronobacter muytjensii]
MSILLEQKTTKYGFRISSVLPLIISLAIVIYANVLNEKYNTVINRALVFALLIFTIKCINNKGFRHLLAVLFLVPVAADVTLQLYAWTNFNSAFSYGFALSVLNTTPEEASSMLGLYWRDGLLFFALLALFIFTANSGAWPVPPRFRRWPAILLGLTLFGFFTQAWLHQIRKSNVESLTQRFMQSTPVSTAKVFMQAAEDNAVMASVGNDIPDYKITVSDTGIDNYVLIVGESARAKNMGIYGYGRDTTPALDAQKDRLLLFRNAIAPAPVTIMAVPMALTADTVKARDPRKYGDNVINIANKAGYDTSWFSRQGKGGAHNNIITGIALNAHQSVWVEEGYDDALLPLLNEALKKPGKKLIVLHLYGSHEPACRRFPANQTVLNSGNNADDCYDNAVRFTDTVMGQVFNALGDSRSSVLYFSDHALIRDPSRAVVYSHGGAKPPREALQVPMFIWYAQGVAAKDKLTGDYNRLWSTDDVNTLAELWLGIHREGDAVKTLSSWLAQYQKDVAVMDTTGKVREWNKIQ